MSEHINDSILEIDDNRWLIGPKLLLEHQRQISASCISSWSDGKGSYFVLSEFTQHLPTCKPLSKTSMIQMIHAAGDASAVWHVGEAIVKVKADLPPKATKEHVTLEYIRTRAIPEFVVPDVYHHSEAGGRYYIIQQRLHGPTLAEKWLEFEESIKQKYIDRIAEICSVLATWEGKVISGVDGNQLSDMYLRSKADSYEPSDLLRQCQLVGMDCSSFVFYHCDLGPTNIILNPSDDKINIIDWETAGYVPKAWIRTKFMISSGMDVPGAEFTEAGQEWRRRVGRHLGSLNFPEVADKWMAQFSS